MSDPVQLGPNHSEAWRRDPKHLAFVLARYKFVAKMLWGIECLAEIGAGDGWASAIVQQAAGAPIDLYDLDPLGMQVIHHDIMVEPLPSVYDAIYSIDVIEHVRNSSVFFRNMASSLTQHGKLIVGTPSLESQPYASEPSRRLHINCMSGETLRKLARHYFRHVFMFSMNDEVVHTGFMPMAHYLFAVCAEPIR